MKTRDPAELAEHSWKLINEAISTGKVTLENGVEVILDVDHLIRLVQWTATTKAKKPHAIAPPEDFSLKSTTGEDDEKED